MANTVLTPPELDPKNGAADTSSSRASEPIFGNELQKTEESIFSSLWQSVKDVFFPEKLPELKLESKPVAVRDPMAVKRDPTSTAIAVVLHAAVILLIVWIVSKKVIHVMAPAKVIAVNMSAPPPVNMPKAERMGGGGGQRGPTPVTKGELPKFADQQIVPPKAPPIEPPKIQIQPTIEVQTNLKMANTPMPNFGMPNAPNVGVTSMGNGSGTGIGSGNGSGLGPGSGGNTGGGYRHVGGSVLAPQLIYGPEPEFSEEARKAKFQGEVIVNLVVDAQGRPQRVRVLRPVGMGLDEKAVEAVRQYKFKPATENGQPVAVELNIAVNFQIF